MVTSRKAVFVGASFEKFCVRKCLVLLITRAWTVKIIKDPSIFVKIKSKKRLMISSKFPKSFRGAGDLVVFYELFRDFSAGFFQKITKHP